MLHMTSLTPYDANVPMANKEWPLLVDRAEGASSQSSVHYWLGLIVTHGWRAAGVAILIFALVVGAASQITPSYYAEGSVLVQPARTNLAEARSDQSTQPLDTSAVDTEVEMLKSRTLSETVIDKLGLLNAPEFNPPRASKSHFTSTH